MKHNVDYDMISFIYEKKKILFLFRLNSMNDQKIDMRK